MPPMANSPSPSSTLKLYGPVRVGGSTGGAESVSTRVPGTSPIATVSDPPYASHVAFVIGNPSLARELIEAYGEDRGEGRHLYRFPVVFPTDRWQSVMPHELATWGAQDKRFWSEYSTDGRWRHCMTHAPVPVDATGRRAVRLFGEVLTPVIDRKSVV